jgi:hypothetical protein
LTLPFWESASGGGVMSKGQWRDPAKSFTIQFSSQIGRAAMSGSPFTFTQFPAKEVAVLWKNIQTALLQTS